MDGHDSEPLLDFDKDMMEPPSQVEQHLRLDEDMMEPPEEQQGGQQQEQESGDQQLEAQNETESNLSICGRPLPYMLF